MTAQAIVGISPERGPRAVRSWGLAPPSTLEVHLERWTRYFAEDPCWLSVHCAQHRTAEPDPLAHYAFCRRLALAVVLPGQEASSACEIKSWGAAPPSTIEEYVASWEEHAGWPFAPATGGGATSPSSSVTNTPAIAPVGHDGLATARSARRAPSRPASRAGMAPPEAGREVARLDVTPFVSAKDVRRALGCSRSAAYDHLRRAGAVSRDGQLLRVSLELWERYVALHFGSTSTAGGKSGPTKRQLGPFLRHGSEKPFIPIVEPRRRLGR